MNFVNLPHFPSKRGVHYWHRFRSFFRAVTVAVASLLANAAMISPALAGPALLIEMPSGAVLYEDRATAPWYPASVTKLMTVYVALRAVRDHRIALDTPLMVSARAVAVAPSKMGLRPGTLVTLENALKMLVVKSANDMAIVIAEGVAGSVEAFAEDMNSSAAELGLTQSHFVNPNGLPHPEHVSSARDLAILARALFLTFPESADLFKIDAIRLGDDIIHNHNDLLGRYPGMDGMKTGFTCAAGFNIVASASQNGRQLIAVVLGAPSARSRMVMTAALLDRGFARLDQPVKALADLPAGHPAAAPDMHQTACGRRSRAVAQYSSEIARVMAPLLARQVPSQALPAPPPVAATETIARPLPIAPRITLVPRPVFDPVPVSVGAPLGYTGLVAQARPAHSPVGTPPPPELAAAYAEAAPPQAQLSLPLAPAFDALPMKNLEPTAAATPRVGKKRAHNRGRNAKAALHAARAAAKHAAKLSHSRVPGKAPAKEAKSLPKQATTIKMVSSKPAAAKPAVHANKTKSKKPEKHAAR